MATTSELAQALNWAHRNRYKVSNPAQQKLPVRKSLVEYGRQAPRKSAFVERVQKYDMAALADPMQPLPANTTVEQLLQDFGQLWAYGHNF